MKEKAAGIVELKDNFYSSGGDTFPRTARAPHVLELPKLLDFPPDVGM